MRANPPGLAATNRQRHAVFTAALEQAQQFMEAAGSTGYATRPVQLFYGLSQLGRGIAAASKHLPEEELAQTGQQKAAQDRRVLREPWRLSGHGVGTPSLRARARDGLSAIMLRGQVQGALPTVARALGSPPLPTDREVPLLDLWAMLPEAQQVPLPGVTDRPAALSYRFEQHHATRFGEPAHTIYLGRIPAGMVSRATDDDYLRWYPGLTRPRPPDKLVRPTVPGGGLLGNLMATWEMTPAEQAMLEHDGVSVAPMPVVRYRGATCMFPGVGGLPEPVHPIVVWWAVLFALSMLARYEPDLWSAMTDVDASDVANGVEHLLDVALDAVPELVVAAIKDLDRKEASLE